MLRRLSRDRKGQAMVEYAMLVAGIALVCAAAVSVLGSKTAGMLAATAAILPGAAGNTNGSIAAGALIETTPASASGTPGITLAVATILGNSTQPRLGNNILGVDPSGAATWMGFDGLVIDYAQ